MSHNAHIATIPGKYLLNIVGSMQTSWGSSTCARQDKVPIGAYSSHCNYRSVLGMRPCTAYQGATVAASIQTYGILIPGKRPCGPKSQVMLKCPWALTRVYERESILLHYGPMLQHFTGVKTFVMIFTSLRPQS